MANRTLAIRYTTEGFTQAIASIRRVGVSFDESLRAAQQSVEEAVQASRLASDTGDDAAFQEAEAKKVKAARSAQQLINNAYRELGIKSSADIEQLKEQAVSAFNALKLSGVASARDIAAAELALTRRLEELDRQLTVTSQSVRGFGNFTLIVTNQIRGMNEAWSGFLANLAANVVSNALSLITGSITNFFGSLKDQIFQAGTTTENLKAQLKTLEGSVAGAEKAYGKIAEFARTTPFELEEVTQAYISLANRGLKPTEKQLTSIGDLAASQGKPLQQYVEAILDAMTGENERLKEFGIKAAKSGEQVSFTFKGITKTVSDSEQAILQALLSFSQVSGVLGGMNEKAKTTEGQLSNLTDSLKGVYVVIFDAIKPALDGVIEAATAVISPLGQQKDLFADINAQALMFRDYLKANPAIASSISQQLKSGIQVAMSAISGSAKQILDYLQKHPTAIAQAVENLGTLLQGMAKFVSLIGTAIEGWGKIANLIKEAKGAVTAGGSEVEGQKNAVAQYGTLAVTEFDKRYADAQKPRLGGNFDFLTPGKREQIAREIASDIILKFGDKNYQSQQEINRASDQGKRNQAVGYENRYQSPVTNPVPSVASLSAQHKYVENATRPGNTAHKGIDIFAPVGTPVVSPVSGTLVYAQQGHTRNTEDSNPSKPGYQPQHSVLIKLDVPISFEGKTIEYVYGTHLSELDPSIANQGTDFKKPVRIEAGDVLGKVGSAGGASHLHLGLLGDRQQKSYLTEGESARLLYGENQYGVPPRFSRSNKQSEEDKGKDKVPKSKMSIPVLQREEGLLAQLVLAEALNQGKIGQALVARSVFNRQSLIQSGAVQPGYFNARSGSLTDIINGKNQYQPVSDGSINRQFSEAQLQQAREAIRLAQNTSEFNQILEQNNVANKQNLLSSTGFRTKSAFNDESQNYSRTTYKDHVFNRDRISQNIDMVTLFDKTDGQRFNGIPSNSNQNSTDSTTDKEARRIIEDARRRTNERIQQQQRIERDNLEQRQKRELLEFDLKTSTSTTEETKKKASYERSILISRQSADKELLEIEQTGATLRTELTQKQEDIKAGKETTGRDISSEIKLLFARKKNLTETVGIQQQITSNEEAQRIASFTKARASERTKQSQELELKTLEEKQKNELLKFDAETSVLPESPEKEARTIQRSSYLKQNEYAKQRLEIEQGINNLIRERQEKISGQLTTGRDITAEIQFLNQRKKALEENLILEQTIASNDIEKTLSEKAIFLSEQWMTVNQVVEELKLNLADSTAESREASAINAVTRQYDSYKKVVVEAIKTVADLIQFKAALGLTTNEEIKQLEALKQKYLEVQDAQNKETLKARENNQLSERQINLDKQGTQTGFDSQIDEGKANQLDQIRDVFGANKLRRDSARAQENLRYQQQLLDLEAQYKDQPELLEKVLQKAQELNEVSLDNIKGQFKGLKETLADIASSAFSQFVEDILSGTKTVDQAFKDMAKSVLKQLAQLATQMLISYIFKFAGAAGGGGGGVKFADGGPVRGPGTGTSDSIPAFLSNGEYVVKADSVKYWGTDLFDDLNSRTHSNGDRLKASGRKVISKIGDTIKAATGGLIVSGKERLSLPQKGINALSTINQNLLADLNTPYDQQLSLPGNLKGSGTTNNRSTTVNQYLNISSPDANSFCKTELQLGRDSAEMAKRAFMRNG